MRAKLLIGLISVTSLSGCKKDVLYKATAATSKSPEEILISTTWKAQELRIQQDDGVYIYYDRGGSSNTGNFDSDSLAFRADGTGTYYNGPSAPTFNWKFTNSEQTKMNMTINFSTPLILTIENIHITDSSFSFGEYYDYAGIHYVAYGLRIPN